MPEPICYGEKERPFAEMIERKERERRYGESGESFTTIKGQRVPNLNMLFSDANLRLNVLLVQFVFRLVNAIRPRNAVD